MFSSVVGFQSCLLVVVQSEIIAPDWTAIKFHSAHRSFILWCSPDFSFITPKRWTSVILINYSIDFSTDIQGPTGYILITLVIPSLAFQSIQQVKVSTYLEISNICSVAWYITLAVDTNFNPEYCKNY